MPRTCTVCIHSDLGLIDAALVAGQPYRGIAKQFQASASAVYRHQQEHLPAALVKANEAGEVAHGDSLLDQVRDLQEKALAILSAAERAGDLKTALSAVREARGCLELLAKITGLMSVRAEVEIAPVINFVIGKGYAKPSEVLEGDYRQLTAGGEDLRQ